MTLEDARNILHVDPDDDRDALINSLLAAVPGYIEISTGMSEADQADEPMVETVTGFILTLWYYSDHSDDVKLQRTIDNLLMCIKLKARTSTQ